MKYSSRTRKLRKSRRRKQNGGVRHVFIALPHMGTRPIDDVDTIGDLRKQIIANYNAYPLIVYGGRQQTNDTLLLVEGATYHITNLTRKQTPRNLVKYLLEPANTDLSTIDRNYLKFASSSTGFQNYAPFKVAMSIYSDEEKAEFFGRLHEHFGFDISVYPAFSTFYDRDSVEILLSLFHDKGLMEECSTLDEVYDMHPKEFMDFIHIMFGEIQHIPGGPEPLFITRGVEYDHTDDVFFENLNPALQEIILTLRQIILGY